MRLFSLGFLIGVWLLHQSASLPSAWWSLSLPLLLLFIPFRCNNVVIIACALVCGYAWAGVQAGWRLQDPLPASLIGQDILVTGYVSSLPEQDTRKQRFEFMVETIMQPGVVFKPQVVHLNWYNSRDVRLQVGQRWQLKLRLKPARNFSNPGMFNYTGWLWQKGIRYRGYVRESVSAPDVLPSRWMPVQQLRQFIRDRMQQTLRQVKYEPEFRALLIGDRSGMQSSTWDTLQRTGTIHLMAISGLHISLIAGLIFLVFRYFWSWLPRACLLIAAPRAAAIAAILGALVYAGLAGFSLPTQRALIMLCLVMTAVIVYRSIRPIDLLAASLFVVLVYDSFAILSVSFWLSFGAVGLIIYQLAIRGKRRGWRLWLRMQWLIGLGLFPLTILFFDQASLIAPVANLVAIPAVTFAILPMAFISLIGLLVNPDLGRVLFGMLDEVMDALWQWLTMISTLPFASVTTVFASLTVFVLVCLVIVGMTLPAALAPRYLIVFTFIPVLFAQYPRPENGDAYISLLDVGQGLAAVVQTRTHTLVFDSGPRFSPRFDAGSAIVLPFLRQQGIARIDHLFISHGDNDHKGGATALLQSLPVTRITSSIDAVVNDQPVRRCEAGQLWDWDGVRFQVLHPAAEDYTAGMSENDLSCVLLVTTRDKQLLLTGDIERRAEHLLVNRYGADLRSHYLVVPHHGSRTSSSAEFVALIKPDVAMLPVGWRNRYRFPSQVVVARLGQYAKRILSTAESGALQIDTRSGEISAYRQTALRYWDWHEALPD